MSDFINLGSPPSEVTNLQVVSVTDTTIEIGFDAPLSDGGMLKIYILSPNIREILFCRQCSVILHHSS